jgi:prephenate dehydrogenase
MPDQLAIFGFGAFGRFMAAHLCAHFEVLVHDTIPIEQAAADLGVRAATLEQAASAPIVVLSVPAQSLEQLLLALRGRICPDAMVLDVCSVKLKPLELMRRLLPPSCRIIGTHPLFGPQSGKDGIAGLPIALCPATDDLSAITNVRAFLSDTLQLRVVETSPDEHDRQMAYVQGLTHLLARALSELSLPETELRTVAYQRLLDMRANLHQDSDALFQTIEKENPYAAAARAALRNQLDLLEQRLK